MTRRTRARAGTFPATHAVLSAPALLSDVLPDYAVERPLECRLLSRSLTDTYLVRTTGPRYILRVYRAGWRTDADVRYEVDVLKHLAREGRAVAAPVARRDGRYLRAVPAPEGRRQVVLFAYAPGKEGYEREDYAALYGRAVAGVHAATDGFRSRHARFPIDLHELLDKPLAAIRPLVEHRPEDWRYLQDLAERLRRRVSDLPLGALEAGFCHGDFHGGNAHVDGDTLTFFDFDCCGPGWRAYDVAVFWWSAALNNRRKAAQSWEQFRRAYTERRPLQELDLAAVPYFVALRHYWLLGLHTGNGQDWGFGWMGDRYFDRALKFLKSWERAQLGWRSTRRSTKARVR